MEKIFHNQELIGILVKELPFGSVPITDSQEPLQVLTLRHKKGEHSVAPHRHTPRRKITNDLQDFLMVRQGRIKIDLYASDDIYVKSLELGQGEVFIRLAGGYGVEFLEDSEVFEVKNGPFQEDKVLLSKKVAP